jgi:hypothetical protein
MLKSIFIAIALLSISSAANALDFIAGNEFNPQAPRGYKVQSGDTFGGHPIFSADGDWTVSYTGIFPSSGSGYGSVRMPTLGLIRIQNGKLIMRNVITISIDQSTAAGWSNDWCSGDVIVRIKINRGQNDRCSVAKITSIPFNRVQTDVLEITTTESNDNSRLYKSIFYVHIENFGLTYSVVTDKSSEFNRRLTEWMTKLLDATVKAAGYDKPADAFKDVLPFSDAINNIKTTPPIVNTPPSRQDASNSPSSNIQERLQRLKELFDRKLINEDEYNNKRKEILGTL